MLMVLAYSVQALAEAKEFEKKHFVKCSHTAREISVYQVKLVS